MRAHIRVVDRAASAVVTVEGNAWFSSLVSDVPTKVVGNRIAASARIRLWIHRITALFILAATSPLMMALAWGIRLDGGPAMFEHYRVGCGGRRFRCVNDGNECRCNGRRRRNVDTVNHWDGCPVSCQFARGGAGWRVA